MRNWVYKVKISGKRVLRNSWEILKDSFAVVGVLIAIAEIISEVFDKQEVFIFYRENYWWICILILIECVWKNWPRLSFSVRIKDSPDVSITIKVCDSLKNEGAVIIPTNSTFDTTMIDDFISSKSVQGQFQIRYFKDRLPDLDKALAEGLKGKKYVKIKDGRTTNIYRYPIGTVSRVNAKGKRAYFLADSDINKNGVPIDADAEDVAQALDGLWNALSSEGHTETYSIPLLGTGRARVRDASRLDVSQQIILSFLAATKEHKVTENLIICIYPKDFENCHWDELCEFLNYQSQYSNVKPIETSPIGTAEETPEIVVYKGEYEIHGGESKKQASPVTNNGLTEREQYLVTLLTGNKMSREQIAEAMGLSMATTNRIVKRLLESKCVEVEGSRMNQRFYVLQENTENDSGTTS